MEKDLNSIAMMETELMVMVAIVTARYKKDGLAQEDQALDQVLAFLMLLLELTLT